MTNHEQLHIHQSVFLLSCIREESSFRYWPKGERPEICRRLATILNFVKCYMATIQTFCIGCEYWAGRAAMRIPESSKRDTRKSATATVETETFIHYSKNVRGKYYRNNESRRQCSDVIHFTVYNSIQDFLSSYLVPPSLK